DQWGTFITTPRVASDEATVSIKSDLVNQSRTSHQVRLEITILDPQNRKVHQSETAPQPIEPGKTAAFQQEISIRNPQLWGIDSPNLYRAMVRVRAGKTVIDDETAIFGIREAKFEAASGFHLNGKNLKIKGVCLHHDGSAFGAAVPLRV